MKQTFEEIYQSYWQKVFRLCMGYTNDPALAQDLTQETFITVWQKQDQFRGESGIGTWIFKIAANRCLRQIEKTVNKPVFTEMPVQIADTAQPQDDSRIKFLYKCIAELNESDRIIISLELEDIKQAEIAEITGISEVNVRVKIHRIKERLAQKFKSYVG
ncbi:RNA polymerase sigma factor [Chitinophagaceae bacterium LWZ2-11]